MPNFEKFRWYKVTEAPTLMVAFHLRGLFALNELAYDDRTTGNHSGAGERDGAAPT